MTRSELFAIMTAGFASVTADIFGLFVKYGVSNFRYLKNFRIKFSTNEIEN
jgi:nucleoside permease NupC